MKIVFKVFLVGLCAGLLSGCSSPSETFLKKYGIKNDGTMLVTKELQAAIDDCSQKGGGIVSLPAGQYLSGTLTLKDNVTLNLEKGATILGSKNIVDYPDEGRRKALLFAENANNISLTGEGEINGSGAAFNKGNDAPNRPTLVLLFDCKNVAVNGIKMSNSGFWTFRFVRCDTVDIKNVNVEGHANWNNDGFDIESRNVTISDCTFDTDDDAICFKSEDLNFVVENVTVTKCKLSSNCNFIKFGTASSGGFRNIKVSDCITSRCSKSLLRFWEKMVPGVTDPITGIAGIALEVVDGGFMEDVVISNIQMEDVQTPIFIRLGKRRVADNSSLKDIVIENITASSASLVASSITGVPGLRVENVEIRNIDLKLKAGGKESDAKADVPEAEKAYPENRMFGVMLPAYGFYLRHADNIRFSNIKLSTLDGTEERPAVFADDVTALSLKDATLQSPDGSQPAIFLRSCKDITLERCTASNPASVFVGKDKTPDSEVHVIK